jgi:hypothetical protein
VNREAARYTDRWRETEEGWMEEERQTGGIERVIYR